jgi:hypothetical protein
MKKEDTFHKKNGIKTKKTKYKINLIIRANTNENIPFIISPEETLKNPSIASIHRSIPSLARGKLIRKIATAKNILKSFTSFL